MGALDLTCLIKEENPSVEKVSHSIGSNNPRQEDPSPTQKSAKWPRLYELSDPEDPALFFLSYKTTTKVLDFENGDRTSRGFPASSYYRPKIILYGDCTSQLPYLERNKCGNGAGRSAPS